MDFNHFLSCHLLDPSYGGARIFRDMVEQAIHAERCGYRGVSIPEHHLINILMTPSPLQMAVKVAAMTQRIEVATAVAVLPIRDMRVFAGEVIQASMLCDNRLILGVGRGAFAYELNQLGAPIAEAKGKFEESLAVLEALLTKENVSWDGAHYRFDALTVMPRPEAPIPIALAIMNPVGIEHVARLGYHVQTTPLGSAHSVLMEQVDAFHRGKAQASAGAGNRLSLQRGLYLARDAADAREKLEMAHAYYDRFENVWSGPGLVESGVIARLPRKQTIEELGESLLICQAAEMIDRLSVYAEIGIDEVIVSSNFGQEQAETLDMMARFASDVTPHVSTHPVRAAA